MILYNQTVLPERNHWDQSEIGEGMADMFVVSFIFTVSVLVIVRDSSEVYFGIISTKEEPFRQWILLSSLRL